MNALVQDLRYAFRGFGRNPGFTLAALLSLAIGIGANTAIFSVANAVLIRPLPYHDADRLVILWNRSPGLNIAQDWFSTAQYFDIKTGHDGFEQVAIAIGGNYSLTGDGEPERIGAIRVSSNLLPMFDAKAAAGRLFLAEEDSPGRPATALLTHGMWTRRYGADPNIVGRAITINSQPFVVAGILSQSFSLPLEVLPTLGSTERPEILLPLVLGRDAANVRTGEDYNIVGKLKRGVRLEQAQAEMDTITARLRRDHPDVYPPNSGLTFGIVPVFEQVVGEVRRALLVLLGSVGFVLLIACANVANLLLARAAARRKEISIRTALGASSGRIVRQLLTESVLLAMCGGALGVVFAFWSMRGIHVLGAKSIPRVAEVAIDLRVLLFTLLLSVFSGILFGMAPAIRVARLDLRATLNHVRGSRDRFRRLLVISELALSVVLLIGAGLLIRSFARLQSVSPGFNATNVLTLGLTMAGRRYEDPPVVLHTYRQLWERLERLPGVAAAGGITALPLSELWSWTSMTVEGRTPAAGENFINVDVRIVAGRYFETMEIPLRRGRFFNEQDTAANPRVIIVDEFMARELWPNQDPIGKRIHFGGLTSRSPWRTVVGVAGRVKQYTLDSDSRIALYVPHTQSSTRAMTVVMRSSVDAAALTAAAKKEIRELDADLPMYDVRTMSQRVDESLARRRFSMLLLGVFAGLALALAAIGIYGVMAYLVSQGARELGIRIALGASQRQILGLIVGQGMTLALAGVTFGVAGALGFTRLIRSFLFGVNATDALTFMVTSVLLFLIALAASYVPAQRAARIDPTVSLRSD
jgi:predicted permease